MKSNYKKLGDYIHQVNIKNVNGNIDLSLYPVYFMDIYLSKRS